MGENPTCLCTDGNDPMEKGNFRMQRGGRIQEAKNLRKQEGSHWPQIGAQPVHLQ